MTAPEHPPLTIREYRPGDEEAILAAFNRIFAEIDPTFRPRTLEQWRWRYLANPGGWRIFLALTPDGEVVSQYAGLGQRVLLEGEPARFCQPVDSLTDPRWRLLLRAPGVFVLTARPFGEAYGGPPPDRDIVFWGLPMWPAWRIGKTHLGYELVRTQLKLACPLERLRAGGAPGIEVQEVGEVPDELGGLFLRAAAGRGAIAVRDREHLDWRFRRRPGTAYAIGLARRGAELLGYAVFRPGDFDDVSGEGLICDWLVAPGEEGAAAALLAWLGERARSAGVGRLVAVFPDTAPEWISFQKAGFHAAASKYFVAAKSWVKRYRMRWLFERWYYTLGDTDLC